jgi:RNA polymerase primary sigma factor
MFEAEPSESNLSAYMREIARHPLLTPEDELRLAEAMGDGRRAARQLANLPDADSPLLPDLEQRVDRGVRARTQLIESNLRLVVSIARRYRGNGLSLLDLIQEGNIGLQIGIDRYDPTKGYRLSTYVFWWIRQTIVRALANDSRTIRLPVHAGELVRDAAAAEQKLQAELGRNPTLNELALSIGVPCDRLGAMRLAATAPLSLDVPTSNESQLTRADMVIDESALASVEAAGADKELAQKVADVLEGLPERERQVLQLRYGLGHRKAWTLAQIGGRLGVTRERARQLEGQALRRLRNDARLRRALLDLAEP